MKSELIILGQWLVVVAVYSVILIPCLVGGTMADKRIGRKEKPLRWKVLGLAVYSIIALAGGFSAFSAASFVYSKFPERRYVYLLEVNLGDENRNKVAEGVRFAETDFLIEDIDDFKRIDGVLDANPDNYSNTPAVNAMIDGAQIVGFTRMADKWVKR